MKSGSDMLIVSYIEVALLAAMAVAILVMAAYSTYIVHVEYKKHIECLKTELELYKAYTQYLEDALEERIARLEKIIDILARNTRWEYRGIKREIARLEGQIRFLRDRYAELNERLLKLERIVSKHQKRIRELSHQVEVLEFAVDRLLD